MPRQCRPSSLPCGRRSISSQRNVTRVNRGQMNVTSAVAHVHGFVAVVVFIEFRTLGPVATGDGTFCTVRAQRTVRPQSAGGWVGGWVKNSVGLRPNERVLTWHETNVYCINTCLMVVTPGTHCHEQEKSGSMQFGVGDGPSSSLQCPPPPPDTHTTGCMSDIGSECHHEVTQAFAYKQQAVLN